MARRLDPIALSKPFVFVACLLPLASSLSLIAAIRLIDAFAPMPVLIYATRTLEGLLAMAVGGLLGGLLFIWLARSVVPR